MPRKLTEQEVIDRIKKLMPRIGSMARFQNINTPCDFLDTQTNQWFTLKPKSILYGWAINPPFESPTAKVSEDNILKRIQTSKPYITEIKNYISSNRRAMFFDNRSGAGWFDAVPRNLLEGGGSTGHPNLNNRKRRTHKQMIDYVCELYPHIIDMRNFTDTKHVCEFLDSRTNTWFNCRPNDLITARQTGAPDIKRGVSDIELELFDFIKAIKPDTVRQMKLGRKTIDIFVPSANLAVEMLGDYWHSEKYHDKWSHSKRLEFTRSFGYNTVYIWEHEWLHHKSQVCNFLISKMNANNVRIGCRKIEFKDIRICDKPIVFKFLNENHIQGAPAHGTYIGAFGAYYDGQLIACATFGKHHRNKNEILLTRLAYKTGHTISGFLSKLSKEALKKYGEIHTFVHLDKSSGKSYLKAGWELVDTLDPDYFYVGNSHQLISKQSRKKSAVKTPTGMTEYEHAMADGLRRCWDGGKLKLVYNTLR